MPTGLVVVLVPFSNSAAVHAAVKALAPLLASALLVHTCSMASEGMLMAGAALNSL